MKSAPFDYHRATSVDDAVAVLTASDGEAKVIAGGQSLVPLLSMRMAQPTVLVDLNGLAELRSDRPTVTDGRARFGSMTRHAQLAIQTHHGLAAEMAGWIGHTAIRTRGTLGGSLAHADPNAECPALALACDAALSVQGADGVRTIPAAEFFAGMLQTALADDEILTVIDLAVPRRWGFAELARRHGDFALVLATVTELADGWRVVVGGVEGTPVRLADAEAALSSDASTDEVGRTVEESIVAYDDLHATSRYRRAMAAELVRRAVDQARRTQGEAS